jgi:hypothetical protein
MSDADEWQKSETRRRGGPAQDRTQPRPPERDAGQDGHLTTKQVERIEDEVREEVAATDPAISDS